MSFDMFSGKQHDDLDPNYIYPTPYIDPLLYASSYDVNSAYYQNYEEINPNMYMNGYMTYMNPYMNYPTMGKPQVDNAELKGDYLEDDFFTPNMMNPQMMQSMQGMGTGMIPPHMMAAMMPPMMFPYMQQSMSQIHMEEFDEEEM